VQKIYGVALKTYLEEAKRIQLKDIDSDIDLVKDITK